MTDMSLRPWGRADLEMIAMWIASADIPPRRTETGATVRISLLGPAARLFTKNSDVDHRLRKGSVREEALKEEITIVDGWQN